MVYFHGKTENNMKDNGNMVNSMAEERSLFKGGIKKRVSGIMGKEFVGLQQIEHNLV